jgi:membrane peptidoglycan carboxypeptidase
LKRLFHLLAVVVTAATVLAATVAALGVIGTDAVHHSASAEERRLPSLSSREDVGSTVYAADGKTVLGVFSGPQFRDPVKLAQVSKVMITAVLDTEDHGFYVHGAFDVSSIARAAFHDLSGDPGLQGGSTIAQQLTKQLYLSPKQTLSRKIEEVVLADRMEQHYSRDRILEAYLNTVYLGDGSYGVQAAAQTYFGEPASRLNLAQSALLAGMIQDPNGYNPVLAPAAARDRRGQVLQRMVAYHDITPSQAAAADASPLPVPVPPAPPAPATDSYYLTQVRDLLLGPGSPLGQTYPQRYAALFEGGLHIYTNLEPSAQAAAEHAVTADSPPSGSGFQEALVSIDPATGAVRALVGGAPGAHYDVITQGRRQPGSGFKLFTLLAALKEGYAIHDTVDGNSPCAIKFPGNDSLVTNPIKNYTRAEGGVMTVTAATANSVNCAYIRLAHEVGLAHVVAMARDLGISEVTAADDVIPSMVIGSVAVHPIEMAAAYAAVADGGVYHPPSFISRIVDRSGTVVYQGLQPGRRVVSQQVAAEADQALQAVVRYGTGVAAALAGQPVAGKTGTTDNNVDAWFNGYTPQLESTVWIGNPAAETPMVIDGAPVYGADYPARTWHDYAAAVLAAQPATPFPALDTAALPAAHYITSPSLVADDVTDHNAG